MSGRIYSRIRGFISRADFQGSVLPMLGTSVIIGLGLQRLVKSQFFVRRDLFTQKISALACKPNIILMLQQQRLSCKNCSNLVRVFKELEVKVFPWFESGNAPPLTS